MDDHDDGTLASDAETAMREMMGFSNFTGTKRTPESRQPHHHRANGPGSGANTQPVMPRSHESKSSSNTTPGQHSSTQFIPASMMPLVDTEISHHVSQYANTDDPDASDCGAMSFSTAQPPNQSLQYSNPPGSTSHTTEGRGYANSKTGFTLTALELREYASGRKEAQLNPVSGENEEVTVYFQPNFIDDDPWSDLMDTDMDKFLRQPSTSRGSYGRGGRDNGRGNRRHQRGGRHR